MPESTDAPMALVTGASGYIGGHLVPRLLDSGWAVRVLTRRRASLDGCPWADDVDVVEGDANSADDLRRAMDGTSAAYYLLHSMGGGRSFAGAERRMAERFAAGAEDARVGRIVYLGGLHPRDEELSPHLASRAEVGRVLLDSSVPTVVLQAAVVIGDGSASFEMLRYLATRLPVMVAPRWLRNRVQPIAVDDVTGFLVAATSLPTGTNRAFDIGGPDVMTYAEMLRRFARRTGLRKRVIVTVPVLTPRLASHWVGLVTPLQAGLAKPLVGSLVHEVVCEEDDILAYLPSDHPQTMGFDEAVDRAVREAPADHGLRNLAVIAAATALVAGAGAVATTPHARWFRRLTKPTWQPPARMFPIVWTLLYADIAATSAATLTALEREGEDVRAAAYRRALAVNLALNALWCVVFWRLRRPGAAAVEAATLTASSADLTRRAGQASRVRGRMLAPYALWCGFATALSSVIARRNRRR